MDNKKIFFRMIPVYVLLVGILIGGTIYANNAVSVVAENRPIESRKTVIIDAGHGGVDGGATSCTGVLESHINLEIALRLNDLMHLLGIRTYMIRTTDDSVYTSGQSIAAKKVSDLKERVRIANSIENATLISIHQNYYTDSRYNGGQIFYAATDNSQELGKQLQTDLNIALCPNSNRRCKKADGVYLMSHVNCTAVLVECGFLSNPKEEANLRNETYQKNLCIVISSTVSRFLSNT